MNNMTPKEFTTVMNWWEYRLTKGFIIGSIDFAKQYYYGYDKEINARFIHRYVEPKWAKVNSIRQIVLSAWMTDYEVDHIVPLKGKRHIDGELVHAVCGLHCEYNLQIVTREQNMEKWCTRWPDMW